MNRKMLVDLTGPGRSGNVDAEFAGSAKIGLGFRRLAGLLKKGRPADVSGGKLRIERECPIEVAPGLLHVPRLEERQATIMNAPGAIRRQRDACGERGQCFVRPPLLQAANAFVVIRPDRLRLERQAPLQCRGCLFEMIGRQGRSPEDQKLPCRLRD